MRPTLRVAAVLVVASAPAWAPAQEVGTGVAASSTPAASPIDKEDAATVLADRWTATASERGYDLASWRSELQQAVVAVSEGRVRTALHARDYGSAIAALTGKNPDQMALPLVLTSSPIEDMGFTPMAPCRILDTRMATGAFAGVRTAGSTTTISTKTMANIAAQGGNAFGCPMPTVDAGAIAFTITLVGYGDNGYVTVFPALTVLPNASTLNFNAGAAPTPMANSSVVQQCVNCGDSDISIYVEGASTHVIIDAIGYYDLPESTVCSVDTNTYLSLTGSCQQFGSTCPITNSTERPRRVLCSALVTPYIVHVAGTNDEVQIAIDDSTTCTNWSTAGNGVVDVPDNVPTSSPYSGSHGAQRTFQLPAYTAATYYLHVDQTLGSGNGDRILQGQFRCMMVD